MNKGVVAGAGLGLVLLAFLGGYWLANNGSAPTAGSPSAPPPVTAPGTDGGAAATAGAASAGAAAPSAPAMPSPSAAVPAQSGAVAPVPGAAGAPSAVPVAGGPKLTPEERRQLRAKLAALQAKGPNVSIAEAQAVMDEVERLGRGEFDPRYFKAVRDMLGYSGRVQALSKELQGIASSSNPKDVARRQAILAEMRDLSDQISQSAAAVQSYARPLPAPAGQQP